jgi:large subunit ribosomal protein L6
VKGPLGELTRAFGSDVNVAVIDTQVVLTPIAGTSNPALWGTYASHVKNMLAGVTTPFSKELLLEGVGFKSEVQGDNLNLALGFSHPVKVKIPKGLKVTAEKNVVTVSGSDIEQVGQFSAYIRDLKKPEPYKGKGFRYRGEVIRRKEGKKTV